MSSEISRVPGKALEGILVISLEQAVAAPYCSSRLADAGARVIKIERREGDFARHYDDVVHGESAYFVWLNRGKESLVLDIKNAADKLFLQNLAARADVFIQNLAPGAAARAGFDGVALLQINPRLIYVDISGYGESGSYQKMKAYDLLVQAESGLASITGTPSEPGRVGVSVCDIACGMYAHSAVLQALYERQKTGVGKNIKVSLFDSLADWMTVPLLHQEYGGRAPERVGLNHPSIAPYGAYECEDGAIVLSIQNEREWASFCKGVLHDGKLALDSRFNSNPRRCANRKQLNAQILKVFSRHNRDTIKDRLLQAKIAFGFLNSVEDLSRHQQLRRIMVDSASGPVKLVAPPVIDGNPADYGKVPDIGEHSEKIKQEFKPN